MAMLDMQGGMRVLVGGRSYVDSQFNRATKAKRQPGSAFKPFVYLAALEGGMRPDSTVQDLPILGTGWSPRNEGGQYRGTVSLRDALALSMNAACCAPQPEGRTAQDCSACAPPRHPVRAAARTARSRWARRR
jgi:membrane carboxypeptidase/penicillin-binding protein